MPNLKDVMLDGYSEEDDLSQDYRLDSRDFDLTEPTVQTFREQQLEKVVLEEAAPDLGETIGLAFENETVFSSISRISERAEDDVYDSDFELSDIQKVEIFSQYQGNETKYLTGATSEEDYNSRKNDIKEDRERNQRLALAGGMGIGVSFAAQLLDPASIALTAATGGLYKVAQTTRMARAIRLAGLAAAENAAIEAALLEGDTQRNYTDVLIAGGAGAVLGGTIGFLSRTRAVDGNSSSVVKSVDEIDGTLSRYADFDAEQKVVKHYETRSIKVEDTELIHSDMLAHETSLKMQANKRPLGNKELAKVAKRKANAQIDIDNLKSNKIAEIAEYWSKTGVRKGIQRHQDEARVDAIEARYEIDIADRQIELDKANEKLAQNDRIFSAKAELRDWELRDRVKKLEKLYPERTPQKEIIRKKAKADLKKAHNTYVSDAISFEDKFKTDRPEGVKDAGAAQTREELIQNRFNIQNLEAEDEWLDDAIDKTADFENTVGRNFSNLPDWLLGDNTILSKSESVEVRALANMLTANPQTGKFGRNAATLIRLSDAQIRRAGKAGLDSGFDDYLKELGVKKVGGYIDPTHRNNFETKVALTIKGKINPNEISESVQQTAKKISDQLTAAGQMRKDAGELGFEDIDVGGSDYFPDIMSREGLSTLSYELGWSKQEIKKLLAKGYETGENALSSAQARLMSHIKYDNWAKGQLYDGDVHSVYRASSAAEAEKLLKDANVPKELIDSFFADILSKEDWKQVSNRARKTLKINWDAWHEVDGKRVYISDIMNTNVSQVVEAYTKESAYGASMAKLGIKSEGMRNRVFTQARTQALDAANSKAEAEAITSQFKRLEDVTTQLKGRPLVDYSNEFNKKGRMLLDATSILRLQQAGFASVGDLARSVQMLGIQDIIANVPGSGAFRNPFNRMSGRTVEGFKNARDDMEELEEILGFFEEDNFHHSFTSRSEEFGSDAKHALGKKIENSIEGVKRVSQWLNLFNTIQGGISKVSARAVNRRLIKDALGSKKLPTGLRKELIDSGMTEERWGEISEWVKANHKKGSINDREIPLWNFEDMDAEMRIDLQTAMSRIHTRSVQRGLVGETNSQWFGPYARFFTQFKSHSLISIEKQLVHDMRGGMGRMAGVTMWGTGLAYASYMAQMNLRALGMPESKREEYLRDNTEGIALAWGVLNKHSQLASVGLIADVGVFSGAMPEDWYDSTRYGYQHGKLDSLVPAMGVVQDGAKAIGSGLNLGFDQFRETQDEDALKDFSENTLRMLPWSKSIYFGEYIKNVTGLSED